MSAFFNVSSPAVSQNLPFIEVLDKHGFCKDRSIFTALKRFNTIQHGLGNWQATVTESMQASL